MQYQVHFLGDTKIIVSDPYVWYGMVQYHTARWTTCPANFFVREHAAALWAMIPYKKPTQHQADREKNDRPWAKYFYTMNFYYRDLSGQWCVVFLRADWSFSFVFKFTHRCCFFFGTVYGGPGDTTSAFYIIDARMIDDSYMNISVLDLLRRFLRTHKIPSGRSVIPHGIAESPRKNTTSIPSYFVSPPKNAWLTAGHTWQNPERVTRWQIALQHNNATGSSKTRVSH